MTVLDKELINAATQFFGWTLLHSLWQGLIAAVLLKAAFDVAKSASANVRYAAACFALFMMIVLPVLTVLWSSPTSPRYEAAAIDQRSREVPENSIIGPGSADSLISASRIDNLRDAFEAHLLPWMVSLWLLGLLLSSARLFGAWANTRRWKITAERVEAEVWLAFDDLRRRLGVSSPVGLLRSGLVRVPTVIGWLKPVVLVPPCAFSGLTPQQLELILAHELAHIRRHDYLINLIQVVAETLLFFHPAAWWVSGQIRAERENSCDDLAVRIGRDAAVYARALVALERLRGGQSSLAMAADGGSLKSRVHRLVRTDASDVKHFAGLLVIVLVGLAMFTIGTARYAASAGNEAAPEFEAADSGSLTIMESRLRDRSESGKLENRPETRKPGDEKPADGDPANKPVESRSKLVDAGTAFPSPTPPESQAEPEAKPRDFIDEMASVGHRNLSIRQLVQLREAGVTANYVEELRKAGYGNLSVKELADLGLYRVTPAFISKVRSAGIADPTPRQLVEMRVHGVTPEDALKKSGTTDPNRRARRPESEAEENDDTDQ